MSSRIALAITILAALAAVAVGWRRFRNDRLPTNQPFERGAGVLIGFLAGVLRGARPWLEVAAALGAVCFVLVPDLVRFASLEAPSRPRAAAALALALVLVCLAIATWRVRLRVGAPVRESILLALAALSYALTVSVPMLLVVPIPSVIVGFGAGAAVVALLLSGRVADPLGRALHVWSRPLQELRSDTHRFLPSPELVARTEELRQRFRRDRRLVIPDLIDEASARAVAEALRSFPVERLRRPRASRGAPVECSLLHRPFTPHRRCQASCQPLCEFARSLFAGPLRDFIRAVTGMPTLLDRSGAGFEPTVAVQAWDRGSFIAPHADSVSGYDRIAVALVWHASPVWEKAWGGVLRFVSSSKPEELVPSFNTLHLWAPNPRATHEVTQVTGPETRFTLSGRLHEPLEGFSPRNVSAP